MGKKTRPLISSTPTTWTWSTAAGAAVTGDSIPITDDPPSAQDVLSMILTGTADGALTATVNMQMGWRKDENNIIWGDSHQCEDSNGDATTWSLSAVESKFEVNIYAQTYFMVCDYVRVYITFSAPGAISGEAAICVR